MYRGQGPQLVRRRDIRGGFRALAARPLPPGAREMLGQWAGQGLTLAKSHRRSCTIIIEGPPSWPNVAKALQQP
jgi:hypothetical protein